MFLLGITTEIRLDYPTSLYEVRTSSSQSGDVFDALRKLKEENKTPYTFQTLEQRFSSLSATWKERSKYSSSVQQITSDLAYLQIISMGQEALPLIFKDMKNDPNHWFVALTSITQGINPIKKEHRGDLVAMTSDWLEWAVNNNYYVA